MIEKEFRALLPMWAACAAALIASTSHVRLLYDFSDLAYVLGAIVLGGLAMGHEYSNGTLDALLVTPVPRWRIWLSKMAVLALMLVTLELFSAWMGSLGRGGPGDPDLRLALNVLPVLAALFVAPWLTMLARGALGGAVFTICLTGMLLGAGDWIAIARYGLAADLTRFRLAFMWWSAAGLSLTGLVMGWRTFRRLESSGRNAEISFWPSAGRARAASRRVSPLRQLIVKELHLQHMTWVLTAIYIACYVTGVAATRRNGRGADVAMAVLTLFPLLIAPLIGALACAEERQLGTHEWQRLLPVSSLRQWIVKAGTALALTGLLAVGLPVALTWLMPFEPARGFDFHRALRQTPFPWAFAFTTLALFISSATGSTMRTLMLTIPALAALLAFVLQVALPLAWATSRPNRRLVYPNGLVNPDAIWTVVLVSLMLLVLRFALANYRTSDRGVLRVGAQVLCTAAAIATSFALAGALGAR